MNEELLGSGSNGTWNKIDDEYHKASIEINDHTLRANIISSESCPLWLLKGTCELDTYEIVLISAAAHVKCRDEWRLVAISRYPNLKNKIIAQYTINKLQHDNPDYKLTYGGDRDQAILKKILSLPDVTEKINIKFKNPIKEWKATAKYKIAMIMAPSWGIHFPPYGVAKLTALMRQYGYSVKVYDPNVEAWHLLKEKHGVDYWAGGLYFVWQSADTLEKLIMPEIKFILDDVIADVIKSNVKVVGFSMYTTNQLVVLYMAKKIRELSPDICIIAGGPAATMTYHWWYNNVGNLFNYVFVGEAEEQLIYLLENLPTSNDLPFNKIIGSIDSRLPLENYPYADYTDYDLSLYVRGLNIETSRGCIAKCAFCAETHFWKYRDVDPERIIEEMTHQVNLHGTKHFWIVDSLINGNLKAFSRLLDLLIEKNLGITWNCYSRCDGRMDLEFFKRIKKSGCEMLSFGIESGSQKVLDDMHKKIKVWEIEKNMLDASTVGISIQSTWLQGFPTETPLDFMHNLQLMYTCRKWINNISPGMGAGITPNSDMDTNWQAYKIQWKRLKSDGTVFKGAPEDKFLGDWWTEGYRSTSITRFIRVKLANIWLKLLKDNCPESIINSGQSYADIDKFYKLTYKNRVLIEKLEQSNYLDFGINLSKDFKGLLAQEQIAFIYILHQVFGELKWNFNCEPTIDKANFGEFITRLYWCNVDATVDKDGNFEIKLYHKLDHTDPKQYQDITGKLGGDTNYEAERKRENMSFEETVVLRGNMKDFLSNTIQVEESVHEKYRKKTWKLESSI
jgi:radical SAM superfamily enzyme YgiQ (UPF0313 family)